MKSLIKIKVTLDEIRPLIWRRLLVKSSTTFYELHNILQIAFGWENSHLYQFKVEDYFIGSLDPEYDLTEMKVIDAKTVKIGKIMTEEGYELSYEYDFGDSWMHTIKVEKLLNVQPDSEYPICSDGKRAAPPENCGGVPGYYQIMKATEKEYQQLTGGRKTFNSEYFSTERVNNQLANLGSYIKVIEKHNKK